MFVVFYLWVRAMLLGVWCMKWYSRNGGRLNIRICVSGSHVGNDEQGVVLYFYVIVYDSRMSLSNVSLPIWHWCSPSVLPLTHPSPFSPKPALEEPRRTSHPERGKNKISFLLLKSHLAAPPRSSSLGAGGGAGGREGSAASGAPPSPSGSIVSWSTAQDTDERNSLGSLRAARKPSRWEDLEIGSNLCLDLSPSRGSLSRPPPASSSPSSPC